MKIKIISVGKTKAKYWQLAEVDFTKRIHRYADLQLIYVRDASSESTKNVDVVKKIEVQRILDKITPEEFVIALDRCGTQMESPMFAQFLHNKMLQRISEFTFVVGGPLGLTQDFLQEADLILSFSKMTFPHELFKVILLEQIYRAFTIIRGEKYHK